MSEATKIIDILTVDLGGVVARGSYVDDDGVLQWTYLEFSDALALEKALSNDVEFVGYELST